MTIHSFYTKELHLGDVVLSDAESQHASKVLRLSGGETIRLMDGCGHTALSVISSVARHGSQVSCRVTSIEEHQKSSPRIHLYLAPPRAKIMELAIRFATEMGVARITPILCRYGVSKPDGSKEGWSQTAIVAMKQSGNPWMPIFDEPVAFQNAVASCAECSFIGVVPREAMAMPLPSQESCNERGVALWIGPEGGFSQEEESLLMELGAYPLTVGPYIMRVETAVPALLGALYALNL